jgi:rhamnulokinase
MAEWEAQGEKQTFGDLLPAAESVNISSIIPVADAAFMNPTSMEKAICDYCASTNQPVPQTKAEVTKCVLQSLAAKYREALAGIKDLLPQPLKRLHIIGGGSQNALLNQLTADALRIPVWAGPVEATAMGNILVQAMSAGEIADIAALREVVRNSVTPTIFEPK